MDTSKHRLPELFAQLGLSSDAADMQDFIGKHRSLNGSIKLCDANWWNSAQSALLKEAIEDDAEWAEAVDELDALLRYPLLA